MHYTIVKVSSVKKYFFLLENGIAKHKSVSNVWDLENSILKDMNYEENTII